LADGWKNGLTGWISMDYHFLNKENNQISIYLVMHGAEGTTIKPAAYRFVRYKGKKQSQSVWIMENAARAA